MENRYLKIRNITLDVKACSNLTRKEFVDLYRDTFKGDPSAVEVYQKIKSLSGEVNTKNGIR